jgi:hypothetical protein
MTTRTYKKIDAWECQDQDCGMVVVSRDAHNKWHAYREANGLAPLSKDAHERGGESKQYFTESDAAGPTRLRSDGEWPV